MENRTDLELCEVYYSQIEKRNSILGKFYEENYLKFFRQLKESFKDLDENTIQDSISDTLFKLAVFLGKEKRSIHNLSNYWYGACRNACLDKIRKNKKKQEVAFEDISEKNELQDQQNSKSLEMLCLFFALGIIEKEKRVCFFLNKLLKYTQENIAQKFGFTEKQVGDRVKKAKEEVEVLLKNRKQVAIDTCFRFTPEQSLEFICQKVQIELFVIDKEYDSQTIIENLFSFLTPSEIELAKKYFLENKSFTDFPLLKRHGLREKILTLNQKISDMLATYEEYEIAWDENEQKKINF